MFNDCVGKNFKYADDDTFVTAAETAKAATLTMQEDCNNNDA